MNKLWFVIFLILFNASIGLIQKFSPELDMSQFIIYQIWFNGIIIISSIALSDVNLNLNMNFTSPNALKKLTSGIMSIGNTFDNIGKSRRRFMSQHEPIPSSDIKQYDKILKGIQERYENVNVLGNIFDIKNNNYKDIVSFLKQFNKSGKKSKLELDKRNIDTLITNLKLLIAKDNDEIDKIAFNNDVKESEKTVIKRLKEIQKAMQTVYNKIKNELNEVKEPSVLNENKNNINLKNNLLKYGYKLDKSGVIIFKPGFKDRSFVPWKKKSALEISTQKENKSSAEKGFEKELEDMEKISGGRRKNKSRRNRKN